MNLLSIEACYRHCCGLLENVWLLDYAVSNPSYNFNVLCQVLADHVNANRKNISRRSVTAWQIHCQRLAPTLKG